MAKFRFGGPVEAKAGDVDGWVKELNKLVYNAAYCPDIAIKDTDLISSYRKAAEASDIIIAEVGAWSNPMSRDDATRSSAIQFCKERLALAEAVGARCCVNISGSLGEPWDGHHPEHYSEATFALIVDSVREIIDAVKPKNTFYTLEMMPWMLPDNADEYLRLLHAIDRPAFGVHVDPVNIIVSPRLYYGNRLLLEQLFAKLGPWIKSCHAKDIRLHHNLTIHLDEVRPGLGNLDYHTFLSALSGLTTEVPLMLEHLPNMEEYRLAAEHIREIATDIHYA